MTDEIFEIIAQGYNDLIARGKDKGVSIYIENHWGSSRVPENIIKYMENIEGLKFLFDTNNWKQGQQQKAWKMCAPYASATHIKTFRFDENGNESTVDIPAAIKEIVDAGYDGIWGVESVPRELDEMEGARMTIKLIKNTLKALGKT